MNLSIIRALGALLLGATIADCASQTSNATRRTTPEQANIEQPTVPENSYELVDSNTMRIYGSSRWPRHIADSVFMAERIGTLMAAWADLTDEGAACRDIHSRTDENSSTTNINIHATSSGILPIVDQGFIGEVPYIDVRGPSSIEETLEAYFDCAQ